MQACGGLMILGVFPSLAVTVICATVGVLAYFWGRRFARERWLKEKLVLVTEFQETLKAIEKEMGPRCSVEILDGDV